MANGEWIVDHLECVGSPGEPWIEQFPKGSKTEFDVRFAIERDDKWGGQHGVNIAIRQAEAPPFTPVLTYNILKGIYDAVHCTDIYGVSAPIALRNSDPTYNTFRTRLMDFPYRCLLPVVHLDVDDDGMAGPKEAVVRGRHGNFGLVMALIQALGEVDLALFLSLELMHARRLLNAIPPGTKGFDIRYFSVGAFVVQACCMAVEHTLKVAALLADSSYNPRRHRDHNSTVWGFIAENHPEIAKSIIECHNNLPEPWDELPVPQLDPPLSDPVGVADVGRILGLLDDDGGIYARARYPYELGNDLQTDEDGVFRRSLPHHDSALPTIRIAVAAMAVIAKSLEQWQERHEGGAPAVS